MAISPFEEFKIQQQWLAAQNQMGAALELGGLGAHANALGVRTSVAVGYDPPPPSIDAKKISALKKAEPRKVLRRSPDGITPITAYRAWAVTGINGEWRLKALGKNHIWEPKKRMDAICDSLREHPCPAKNCECGIWAFTTLDELLGALPGYETTVIGQVSLWGKIVQTTKGFRAQYAYPKELWLLDGSLEELGYIYGVPIRTAE